jgi:hypothetical protein
MRLHTLPTASLPRTVALRDAHDIRRHVAHTRKAVVAQLMQHLHTLCMRQPPQALYDPFIKVILPQQRPMRLAQRLCNQPLLRRKQVYSWFM